MHILKIVCAITKGEQLHIAENSLTPLTNKVVVYQDIVEVILIYGSDLLKPAAEDYNSKASALRFYFDGIITVYEDKKRKHGSVRKFL